MLTEHDKKQLHEQCIEESQIFDQINRFKKGFQAVELVSAATLEKGIICTSEVSRSYYINIYDHYSAEREIVKFVPASGAASRMFKDMYACLEELKKDENNCHEIINRYTSVKNVLENLSEMALFPDLELLFEKQGKNIPTLVHCKDYIAMLEGILSEEGLNYGNLPKALLKFHNYGTYQRKAIDEHLVEGALYAVNNSGNVFIHFTISPEHEKAFLDHLQQALPFYEWKFGISFTITHSFQHPSTDTVAVDLNNELFRDENGKLLFRPSGHGALIKNLNELSGDLIFIKNIDNVTTDRYRSTTVEYKKVLAGILLEKEIAINGNLAILIDDNCSIDDISQISEFVTKELLFSLPPDFSEMNIEKQRRILLNNLNRPIRVCGMVKNEGEPGGGPFFVRNQKSITSLQIVEKSQIEISNPQQLEILNSSTHFNPVDIVARIVDYLGRKFDLNDFVDHNTYMISEKSKDGKPLKALELPGLWNGAMAGWITFFVEVPLETFSPVKEINDLLRDQHKFVY